MCSQCGQLTLHKHVNNEVFTQSEIQAMGCFTVITLGFALLVIIPMAVIRGIRDGMAAGWYCQTCGTKA